MLGSNSVIASAKPKRLIETVAISCQSRVVVQRAIPRFSCDPLYWAKRPNAADLGVHVLCYVFLVVTISGRAEFREKNHLKIVG